MTGDDVLAVGLLATAAVGLSVAGYIGSLKDGECADLEFVCKLDVDGKENVHSELWTLANTETFPDAFQKQGCRVATVGKPYACKTEAKEATKIDSPAMASANKSLPDCVCSSGKDCLDGEKVVPKGVVGNGFKGAGCYPTACHEHAEELSSTQAFGYSLAPECGGKGRWTKPAELMEAGTVR